MVELLKNLGSLKSAAGNCHSDIISRVGMAKKRILQSDTDQEKQRNKTRAEMELVCILRSLVWTVLVYGAVQGGLRRKLVNEK